ncbi:DUF2931 family protein [Marinobacter sp. 1Y8]
MIFEKALGLLLICIALSACSSTPENGGRWYLGVAAPKHYDVWVDTLELEASGTRHWRMPMGIVSCCWRGAHGPRGSGGTITPFPDYIGIEWFSFAEQKYYQRVFSLPEGLEQKMREPATYTTSEGSTQGPRNILTIGLAPGGTIVLWIQNQIGNEVEVARIHANEVDGNPSDFAPMMPEYNDESAAYLNNHGIPTEGW